MGCVTTEEEGNKEAADYKEDTPATRSTLSTTSTSSFSIFSKPPGRSITPKGNFPLVLFRAH